MHRFVAVFAILLVCAVVYPAHAKDQFEGTTWKVSVTPDDDARGSGERPFDDTLKFKGGKFTSEHFKAKGFDAADIDTNTRRGPLAGFTVEAKSEKNGTLKWTGTTTGSTLNGDLVWTKADGTVLNYTFSGEPKG